MGQKDLSQKELLQYPDVFADVVNSLFFNGKNVVSEGDLYPAETESIYLQDNGILHNQLNDVSKYQHKEGHISAQYIVENQTKIDSRIILRKIGYLGAIYRRMYDQEKVYPVFLIVLYWGKRRWKGGRTLKELLKRQGNVSNELSFADDFKVDVFEMSFLPKEIRARFTSDLRIAVDYLAEGGNYKPTRQVIKHVEAFLRFMKYVSHTDWYEKMIPQFEEKGEVTMCELLERYGRESRLVQLYELVQDAIISVMIAAQKAELSEEEFVARMEEAGYRLPKVKVG